MFISQRGRAIIGTRPDDRTGPELGRRQTSAQNLADLTPAGQVLGFATFAGLQAAQVDNVFQMPAASSEDLGSTAVALGEVPARVHRVHQIIGGIDSR